MRTPLRSLVATMLSFSFAATAFAVKFPDVPATYPHKADIEQLSEKGVIGGNPDGTFKPTNPVNRAAMLKMLYLASGRVPGAEGGCFIDVEKESWYESYVCDAHASGFVQGYESPKGNMFKPAQPVTRAEAIKLTLAVFGIPMANLNAPVTMYKDIKTGEWHTIYIHTALALGILPIAGQDGEEFKPASLLERGEAAAYINHALPYRPRGEVSVVPTSSSSSAADLKASVITEDSSSSAKQTEAERRAEAAKRIAAQEAAALEKAKANSKAVNIPFAEKREFNGQEPYSYTFPINGTFTVEFTVHLDSRGGTVSCRLYNVGRSGFSQEYYLGFGDEDTGTCVLRATVSPGNWLFQVDGNIANEVFTVDARKVQGNGNDGFSQAVSIPLNAARTGLLDDGDHADWYKFIVPSTQEVADFGGLKVRVHAIPVGEVGCIIYPMFDVDQFGFVGPQCEKDELLKPGTYVVGVQHPKLREKQAYTVKVDVVK